MATSSRAGTLRGSALILTMAQHQCIRCARCAGRNVAATLTVAPAARSAAMKAVRFARNGCTQSATSALVGKRATQATPLGSLSEASGPDEGADVPAAGAAEACAVAMVLSRVARTAAAYARRALSRSFKEGMRAGAKPPR